MESIDDDRLSDHEERNHIAQRARRPGSGRKRQSVSRVGNYILIAIVCCFEPSCFWQLPFTDGALWDCSGKVIGLALSRWVFEEPNSLSADFDFLASRERQRIGPRDIFGFLSYPIIEFAKLASPFHLSVSRLQQIQALCSQHGFEYDFSSSAFTSAAHRLQDVVDTWLSRHAVRKAPRLCIVELSPGMVQSVLTKPRIVHIIAVTKRVHKRRLLCRAELTPRMIQKLRESCSGLHRDAITTIRSAATRKVWKGMLDVRMVLDWLDASLEVRNVRHLNRAALKFAAVFASANSLRATTILGHLKPANFQTIRSARIKLDAVACNLFRQLWERLIDDRI